MMDAKPCGHKWVFLRKSETYEVGYRKWAHDDTFFCEKCLEYKTVQVDHGQKEQHRGW